MHIRFRRLHLQIESTRDVLRKLQESAKLAPTQKDRIYLSLFLHFYISVLIYSYRGLGTGFFSSPLKSINHTPFCPENISYTRRCFGNAACHTVCKYYILAAYSLSADTHADLDMHAICCWSGQHWHICSVKDQLMAMHRDLNYKKFL